MLVEEVPDCGLNKLPHPLFLAVYAEELLAYQDRRELEEGNQLLYKEERLVRQYELIPQPGGISAAYGSQLSCVICRIDNN